MRPGPVFLDQSVVVLMESFPPKVAVHLIGNLPTPCNNLRVKATGPDQEKQINLEVYSIVATDIICVQSLAPFDESILLGSFPSGKYGVRVNGKAIGNFEMP